MASDVSDRKLLYYPLPLPTDIAVRGELYNVQLGIFTSKGLPCLYAPFYRLHPLHSVTGLFLSLPIIHILRS